MTKGLFLFFLYEIHNIDKEISCCKPTLVPFSCENPVCSPSTPDIGDVKFLVLALSPGGRTLSYAISSGAYWFAP